MSNNMLAGIQPAKEDTKDVAVMDTLAQGMLDRGFSSLWSRPANEQWVYFGDKEKRKYLIKLATTGRKALAAAHAGTTAATVCRHRNEDKVFAAACEEASAYFHDILLGEMFRRGVEGYEQEVLGGRNKDQIFRIKTYSDKMMDTLGRIHIKELQKNSDSAVTVAPTTIINNQFDMENMPPQDLAMMKHLLQNQQKRIEEAEANANAIEGEASTDG
jgi:hypothetical protein